MDTEKMDRGGCGTAAMNSKLMDVNRMEVRHSRRGWLQEFFCCITKSDFKYYVDGKKMAESKEEFDFLCRCCCAPAHAFDMNVKVPGTDDEIIEFNRPCRCCMMCCKCCCYQEAVIYSGGEELGEIRETWWWFVPQFKVYDDNSAEKYIIHPPTCCGGVCIDYWTEGPPCPHGCCMIPFRIYAADAASTNENAPYLGIFKKIPKETFCDTYHETSFVDVQFPDNSTKHEKGLLLGSFLLINALYFENSE